MKKILLLIIPAVLLISGCGSQSNNDVSNDENTNPEKEIIETMQNMNEVANENSSEDSEVKTTKEDCIAWCELMWTSNTANKDKSKDEMAIDCNSLCDAAQWIENNDVSECEKAQWLMRDSCFTDIAQDLNQPDICEKITEPTMLYWCLATLAEQNKDLSICDKITDQMWNWICKENVNNKE